MTTTSDLVSIAKSYYVTAFKTAAMSSLISFSPIFATGPLNYLASRFINWLANKTADQLELQMFFVYTDLRVSTQGKGYYEAIIKLNKLKISNAPQDQILQAEKDAFAAFNLLVCLRT